MMGLEAKVKRTIKDYKMLSKKDKVIVACSGGKDSTTALYLLNKLGYKVEALFIDLGIPCYSIENLKNLTGFCKELSVKLNIVRLADELGGDLMSIKKRLPDSKMTYCALCGVIKRRLLNKKARELGGAKLATGHNLDDEAENLLLNIFGGNIGLSLGLGPVCGVAEDKMFVTRIKPLYWCSNEETKNYTQAKRFKVLYSKCPLITLAFRKKVRGIIKELMVIEPRIKENMVKSFLKKLPNLRRDYAKKFSVKYCSLCGEPCRGEICKTCELIRFKSRG